MKKIESLMRCAIQNYNMIEEGDSIAVGISGGKDSLVLLLGLANLRKYYPLKFTLKAITADYCFGGEKTDFSQIEELCNKLSVEYKIVHTELYKVIFEERKEKNPCSLCAKMRRGVLHKTAKEMGCNKIAFAHHYDDAVETFLMNLLDGGTLGCFSPLTYLSNRDITLIRPMILCEEKQVENVANKLHLPIVKSKCPVDKTTEREKTKKLLASLEKDYPSVKKKIMGAICKKNLSGW